MSINLTDALSTQASATATSPRATTTTAKNKAVDQNMFLTLLVAQLKHQDPLAPQDGTQFVAQLAQFNSLEQLSSINHRIGELLNKK